MHVHFELIASLYVNIKLLDIGISNDNKEIKYLMMYRHLNWVQLKLPFKTGYTYSILYYSTPLRFNIYFFRVLDVITFKQCDQSNKVGEFNVTISPDNVCHGAAETEQCEKGGGKCVTEVDGYYTESFICCAFGFLWLGLWGWRMINRLQSAEENEWRVVKKSSSGSANRKGDKERLL